MKFKGLYKSVPTTEFSVPFVQGMADRMGVSFHKYGAITDAYPLKVNAIKSLRARLERYEETGNTELLMDVANFAMIEFLLPGNIGAHFAAETSEESIGRIWAGETRGSKKTNRERR